ncbi:MAG: methyl-accepting chemotaxis protein [Firmicutes bacterium]|nr:methyl-accepting chemotaxis protein [Bacillota bacterium]
MFKSIKIKILIPVMLILIAAVTTIVIISYFITHNAVTEMIDASMTAVTDNIVNAYELSEVIKDVVFTDIDNKNIALARAFAEMIRLNPSLLDTSAEGVATMQMIAEKLNVYEVHVADGNGILQYGNIPGFFGFDYSDNEQSQPFLDILADPTLEFVQDPMPNAALGIVFSYVGVARTDAPGFVQVGIPGEAIEHLNDILAIQQNIERTRLGTTGSIFIVENGIITAHPDRTQIGQIFTLTSSRPTAENRQWSTINGMEYYTEFYAVGNSIIYAIMPIAEFYQHINQIRLISLLISVAAVVIMGVIILIVLTRITNPITNLLKISREMAAGNTHINREKTSNDEIGLLTQDIYVLSDVIGDLMDDFAQLEHEYNINGNIDFRANSAKYMGSFKKFCKQANALLDSFNQDMFLVFEIMKNIDEGNFDVEIQQMPGKKSILNTNFNEIMENMKELNNDVTLMFSNLANGELDKQADITKYKGAWAVLFVQLNKTLLSIADPVAEIEKALSQMAKGEFLSPVQGNYRGAFNTLKETVNSTGIELLLNVNEITAILVAISHGDLTVPVDRTRIDSYRPIKEALINILTSLNTALHAIQVSSDKVQQTTTQIADSSANLAQATTRQTESVEEINNSIEQVKDKIRNTAQIAITANEKAQQSTDSAHAGSYDMEKMVESIESIKSTSDNISNIIKVIDNISFQTNLLALNASVEAARAGEHGKGFSVVAEEVRNLATRSQSATKNTESEISITLKEVDEGIKVAEDTSKSLDQIVQHVREVSELISKIAEMSQEQAITIDHIYNGINQISEVVKSNSETSHEVAAASRELDTQTEIMLKAVDVFHLREPRDFSGGGELRDRKYPTFAPNQRL